MKTKLKDERLISHEWLIYRKTENVGIFLNNGEFVGSCPHIKLGMVTVSRDEKENDTGQSVLAK